MNHEAEPSSGGDKTGQENLILEEAKHLASSYWGMRLARNKDLIERTKKDLSLAESYQGVDFDIARCRTYIRVIKKRRVFY